jgi:hypothetical protein
VELPSEPSESDEGVKAHLHLLQVALVAASQTALVELSPITRVFSFFFHIFSLTSTIKTVCTAVDHGLTCSELLMTSHDFMFEFHRFPLSSQDHQWTSTEKWMDKQQEHGRTSSEQGVYVNEA